MMNDCCFLTDVIVVSHMQQPIATSTRRKTQALEQVLPRLSSKLLLVYASFFSTLVVLFIHGNNNEQFKCPFCDNKIRKNTLKTHMKQTHPEKVPPPFIPSDSKKKKNNHNVVLTSSTSSTPSTTSSTTSSTTLTSPTQQTNGNGSLQSSSEVTTTPIVSLQSPQELKAMKIKLKAEKRKEKKEKKEERKKKLPFGCSLCKNKRFSSALGLQQHKAAAHKPIQVATNGASSSTSISAAPSTVASTPTQEHPTTLKSVQTTHTAAPIPTTTSTSPPVAVTPTQ